MYKVRNKKIALMTALVFVMTLVLPMGAAFADEAAFGKSYSYISTDDTNAGVAKVWDDGDRTTVDDVYVEVTLPDGVEFADEPTSSDFGQWVNGMGAVQFDRADSDSIKVYVDHANDFLNSDASNPAVEFDFADTDVELDIDDDFTGNMDVDVEVTGVSGGEIVWAESDTLTIAKVAGGDVTVTADDAKKVSVGGGENVAEITLEESKAGDLTQGEIVYLEIDTSGVSFDETSFDVAANGVGLQDKSQFDTDEKDDADSWIAYNGNDTIALNEDKDKAWVKVDKNNGAFPGELEFDFDVNIDPDVSGDIEVSVWSENEDVEDETVTVATVGDTTAEVTEIDDNDTVAYAGQETDLDVEFTIETGDGSNFDAGDIITFELNNGEFVNAPNVNGSHGIDRYSDDEAFYVTTANEDEVTISDIVVELDNDAEAGDLTLNVGGDYGDLGEVTIGEVAQPFTVTADKTEIMAEALGQEAGDITITETDDDAFVKDDEIYVELPSGVELSKKPSIEAVEGSADAEIKKYDDDYFIVRITEGSSSKASELRVYNLKYDAGKLAMTGDVELKFRGYEDEDNNGQYTDDAEFTRVANATVVDQSQVEASFTLGEEGVAVQNGRTLVQVNELCDVLGLQKSWDAENKTAYFVKDGTVVAFPIDQNKLVINGNEITVDQGGTIINDYTYATLRGIQMAFGGELDWDNDTKTATFNFTK